MTLAAPVGPNWLYDLGERTSAELATAVAALETKINTARQQAKDMVDSGNYGPTNGRYRAIIRGDSNNPQGFTVEIRQVTT